MHFYYHQAYGVALTSGFHITEYFNWGSTLVLKWTGVYMAGLAVLAFLNYIWVEGVSKIQLCLERQTWFIIYIMNLYMTCIQYG